MKITLCSFLFMLFLLNLSLSQSYPTFDEYMHDFGKNYPEGQKHQRKQIYDKRIASFESITDYIPGVNNFTDWTQQQISGFKRYRPRIESNIISDDAVDESHLSVSAPLSIDWRESKAVTSIKTQGTCGSCWAFSVAAYVQSKLIIQKGYGQNVDLSQQYLVSCTSGSDCEGGYIDDAMKVVALGGIPYESSFPYNPYGNVNSHICETKNKVTEAGNKVRVAYNISDSKIIDLLQSGPLVTSLSADNWQNYRSGVFICPSNAVVNHAVLLVGYTADYWIVKNQWAKTWGESGYMKITRQSTASYMNCYIGGLVTYINPVAAQTSFSINLKCLGALFILLMALFL